MAIKEARIKCVFEISESDYAAIRKVAEATHEGNLSHLLRDLVRSELKKFKKTTEYQNGKAEVF